MNSLRIFLSTLSLAALMIAVAGAADSKVTNWRVVLSTEVEKSPPLDSLIEPHTPSPEKAQEKVDAQWEKLKAALIEQIPVSFYSNPPHAGEISVTVVLKQKLSPKNFLSSQRNRASDVADALHKKDRLPSDNDEEVRRRRDTEALKLKAKEYEIVGLRIVLRDIVGREALNVWCQTKKTGKVDLEKCAPQIADAMRRIAARPETPVFEEHP